jgi:hypothetical protein
MHSDISTRYFVVMEGSPKPSMQFLVLRPLSSACPSPLDRLRCFRRRAGDLRGAEERLGLARILRYLSEAARYCSRSGHLVDPPDSIGDTRGSTRYEGRDSETHGVAV